MSLSKIIAEIVKLHFDDLSDDQIHIILSSLDSQYKFSKEFNSELNIRFKLWKNGFMSEQNNLPGLLAHEEESLKVYLSIMFKQFFKWKHAKNNNEDVSK